MIHGNIRKHTSDRGRPPPSAIIHMGTWRLRVHVPHDMITMVVPKSQSVTNHYDPGIVLRTHPLLIVEKRMPLVNSFHYVQAVCGFEEHEECFAACGVDPILLDEIPPENVLRLIVHNIAICYNILALYDWLLIRNREPTSQSLFTGSQLRYITHRYRGFTGNADAYDLSVTGMADIFIGWLQQDTTWTSSFTSWTLDQNEMTLEAALDTLKMRIYTDNQWSRDALDVSFSRDQVTRPSRVTLTNLGHYNADEWLVDQIFNVLYRHLIQSQEVIGGTLHRCIQKIHRALSSYIESESQVQKAMLLWGRYIDCQSPNLVSTWLAVNGSALSECLSVETFEEFGDFHTLSIQESTLFVLQMNKMLLSILNILDVEDMDDFVWTPSIDVLKLELST
jgi:hypothetical protein